MEAKSVEQLKNRIKELEALVDKLLAINGVKIYRS